MCGADEDLIGGQGSISSSGSPPKEECLGCGGSIPVDDLEDGLCLGCRAEPDLEDEFEDPEFEDPEPFGRVVA